MVVELFVNLFITLLNAILYVIPNVPEVPATITTAVTQITDNIVSGVNMLAFILTPTLLLAGISIVTLALTYRYLYKLAMWLVLKLPWAIQ